MTEDTRAPRAATRRRLHRLLTEVRAGNSRVEALADRLGVSASTVRRDLAQLVSEGRVHRTYGGAVVVGVAEAPVAAKEQGRRAEKDAIARRAAALVPPGATILLDAGTTTARLAAELADRHDITIVTNGISALLQLVCADVELVVLGGRRRRPNEALLGPAVRDMLERLWVDVAFLGADGVDPRRGLSCPTMEQARVKSLMRERADEVCVLADSSKTCRTPFPYLADVGSDWTLVTDSGVRGEDVSAFHDAGVDVLVAPLAGGPDALAATP